MAESDVDTIHRRGQLANRSIASALALSQQELPSPDGRSVFTARQFAVLMGFHPSDNRPKRWIRQKILIAHKAVDSSNRLCYWITHDAMLTFLADERYWHVWQPDKIQDLALREWTRDLRKNSRLLTVKQVAARMHFSTPQVRQFIYRKLLPARRWGRDYFISTRDLAAFVLPPYRKKEPRRILEYERLEIVALHAKGLSAAEIARQLNLSRQTVWWYATKRSKQ